MSSGVLFKYELKRLLFSREYLLLSLVTFAYSVSLLRSVVLFGANYTAPFSRLTFSTYISGIVPLLLILLLTLSARQYRVSDRCAMVIIHATPFPEPAFKMIRYVTIACAFSITSVLPFGACFILYRWVFDYTMSATLSLYGITLLYPSAILVFGISVLFGEEKPVAIYILLSAVLIIGVFGISLPSFIDIIGYSQFQQLNGNDSESRFSTLFTISRAVFVAIGIGCILLSLGKTRKNKRRL